MRRQAVLPNLQYDQVDLSCMIFRQRVGLSLDEVHLDELTYLICDVRGGTCHQRTDCNATMETASLFYYHTHDRILRGEDHLFLQGWGSDIRVDGLSLPSSNEVRDDPNRLSGCNAAT